MVDKLYDDFYDPSDDFCREPRAFCYELATEFVNRAKRADTDNWYEDINTVKGVLLLLYTWNFAAKETKKLNFQNVGELIRNTKRDLQCLERCSIRAVDEAAWDIIESVFEQFRSLLGQTGASKALSLLNPELFVMWDTEIRKRLNKELISGIMNGESGKYYVTFLKGVQKIINNKDYGILQRLAKTSNVAKKIDEYHYVAIVMKKRQEVPSKKGGKRLDLINIDMPNDLRGRSIHDNVIPTVCNLKNMLARLKEVHGEVSALKAWEKRSYNAYRIEAIKVTILNSSEDHWKEIIRRHILRCDPSDMGASCIDIYLVAYVSNAFGAGKKHLFKYIKTNGISEKKNTAQAIWQVGKGDGVFLDILHDDGTIKDVEFLERWIRGG